MMNANPNRGDLISYRRNINARRDSPSLRKTTSKMPENHPAHLSPSELGTKD